MYGHSSCSKSLSTLEMVSLFNLSHCDGCIVVSHSDFHSYFPDD